MSQLRRRWWRQKTVYYYTLTLILLAGLILMLAWVSHRERHATTGRVEHRPRISTVPFPPPSDEPMPSQPDSSSFSRAMAYHDRRWQPVATMYSPSNPFFHLIVTAEQLAQNASRDLGLFIGKLLTATRMVTVTGLPPPLTPPLAGGEPALTFPG